jgi:acyl transferase domain-containing protein
MIVHKTGDSQEAERKVVLRKALDAIDSLQAELAAVERDRCEPIAIVGLSCRFPGAPGAGAFWRLLRDGVDAVREVPPDRWDKDAYCGADLSASGIKCGPYGGFLDRVDLFDAAFFGISGREAESMDPQQRLVLEVAWEALENAGIAADTLRGSSTGVFVGVTTADYGRLAISREPAGLDVYTATGGALNVIAGRLSYVLGLHGPAMSVDTACSSSLVAVHLACQSLRWRESDLVLAGGVNVLLTPEPFICFTKWGMMAADGRCKTFDEAADGFVRGEGCGVIVLKRLSDAMAAGDQVLALIRGTAVNQDGATSGLTVPNGLSQQAVVQTALRAARLQPADVDYVEAHGTGTTLGDPIELEALVAALGKNRPPEKPLMVGSVKTNIGHLESASGMAGLIKVVLALQNEEIPPHLHFRKLSPRISLRDNAITIPVCATPWRRSGRPRVAGVSSFGFSGTNGHAILQEAPVSAEATISEAWEDRSAHLLVLSAESPTALQALSRSYSEHLAEEPALQWPEVCHTAATGRSALSHRLAVPAPDSISAREALSAFARGAIAPGVVSGRSRTEVKLAFLFTGQGSQYPGMGAALYRSEPVFRDAFDQCGAILRVHLDHPLQDIVGYDSKAASHSQGSILDETAYTQPALFALEYALSALWRSWGIEPTAVIGHSLGEYVAACVAGVLSLEDALRLVALRARLMQALPRVGSMAAILASEERVLGVIAPYKGDVAIAAANGPDNVVISGATELIVAISDRLRKEGVEVRPLTVSHAFHSRLIEPMLSEFERLATNVNCNPSSIDLASNVTGDVLTPETKMDAAYWCRHARGTVRFAESIRALHARGVRVFLEAGPAPVLIGMAQRCVDDPGAIWLASLRRDQEVWPQILSTLGSLFVLGMNPDWKAFDKPHPRRRVSLPTYPFQRERFWLPAAVPRTKAHRSAASAGSHPLLGVHMALAKEPGTHIWQSELSLERFPWLIDHQVQGVVVVPATAFVELAIAAAIEAVAQTPVVISQIEIEKVLLLHPGLEFSIQTRLELSANGVIEFEVFSQPKGRENGWTRHANGHLRAGGKAAPSTKFDASFIETIKQRCAQKLDGREFYRLHHERGNQWGPGFQGVRNVWRGNGEALSEVEAPVAFQHELQHYQFHPALSDAAGHVLTATIPLERGEGKLGGAFVGAGIEEIRFYRRPESARLWAYARIRTEQESPENVLIGDVQVYDNSGNLISETLGARLWYLDAAAKRDLLQDVEGWFYEPRWISKAIGASTLVPEVFSGTWVVFRDNQGVGAALCDQLRARGAKCVSVLHGEQASAISELSLTARPENLEDYASALAAAVQSDGAVQGIVHLWSLDAIDPELADLEAVRRAQTCGPISVLRLVQALEQARPNDTAKLWLVTRGAQPAGEHPSPLSLLQAPLWGLGRTIAVEHSDLWGGQVDLDPSAAPATSATLLLQQMADDQREDQVAFRDGVRRVLRLARWRSPKPERKKISVRPDASYLITGGLGGIGLAIANWLATHGARKLVLAGRRLLPAREEWETLKPGTPDAHRIEAVRALERMGVDVRTVSVEMGDEASVSQLIRGCLLNEHAPLRGVFHAAGVMQYQPLSAQSPDQMREVLAAKVVGGWLLHRLLADIDLEFFVLFSSSSSLLSSPLMGGYSAANAFLDALAHHRRALGRTALSINWGTWGDTGMATRFLSDEGFKRQGRSGATKGLGALSTRKALEALSRLVESGAVQAGVIPINWEEWRRTYVTLTRAPYLSLLMSETEARAENQTAGHQQRERVLSAPPEARAEVLRSYLAESIASILKVPLASIDAEKPISSLGFDSLMSIELKTQIEKDLAVGVAMARLIEGPTLIELTRLLVDSLAKAGNTNRAATASVEATEWEEGQL